LETLFVSAWRAATAARPTASPYARLARTSSVAIELASASHALVTADGEANPARSAAQPAPSAAASGLPFAGAGGLGAIGPVPAFDRVGGVEHGGCRDREVDGRRRGGHAGRTGRLQPDGMHVQDNVGLAGKGRRAEQTGEQG
jgi:hypothetical protein